MPLFKISLIGFFTLLFFGTNSCKPSPNDKWQISYSRVDYFFGSIDVKIGNDSCYYRNQGGIHKNPPFFKWKSSKRKLNNLYREIEKFRLQDGIPLMASVTEEPFETLKLINNGKVIFSIQKQHQTVDGIKKFEEVVAILKAFAFSENNGWKN
jgi:hypothetical protein